MTSGDEGSAFAITFTCLMMGSYQCLTNVAELQIMGRSYVLPDDQAMFERDVESFLWFSYRRNFRAIGQLTVNTLVSTLDLVFSISTLDEICTKVPTGH